MFIRGLPRLRSTLLVTQSGGLTQPVESQFKPPRASMHTYEYPRPALTVDIALIGNQFQEIPKVLLIKRRHDPFAGAYALPGGFVDEYEPLQRAAQRELMEETAIQKVPDLRQIETFGDPGRDPRGWTVTVLFGGIVGCSEHELPAVSGMDDAAEASWFDIHKLPPLAFDHPKLLVSAFRNVSRWDNCPNELKFALEKAADALQR